MSQKIVPVSAEHHSALKVNTSLGYPHAAKLDSSPLTFQEIEKAAADYALFLTKDVENGRFRLVALLGLGTSNNAYQNESGWNATYIPKNIRRYPFLIAYPENGKNPILCIDETSPHLNVTKGNALFEEDGTPSAFHRDMQKMLTEMLADQQKTDEFIEALNAQKLITPVSLDARQGDRRRNLEGLYTIDGEQLSLLNAEQLQHLHLKGFLKAAFLIQASLTQLSRLTQLYNAQAGQAKVEAVEIRFPT